MPDVKSESLRREVDQFSRRSLAAKVVSSAAPLASPALEIFISSAMFVQRKLSSRYPRLTLVAVWDAWWLTSFNKDRAGSTTAPCRLGIIARDCFFVRPFMHTACCVARRGCVGGLRVRACVLVLETCIARQQRVLCKP